MEIEGGADADEDGRGEPLAVGSHPLFLLGAAQAHEDDVGPGRVDLADLFGLLLGRQRPEGGSACSGHL